MEEKYQNNEYEIFFVTKDLMLLRTIRPLCLQKAKDICRYLSNVTHKPIYWFYNVHEDEIEIYTDKDNFVKAKELLKEFEQNYVSTLKRRKNISSQKHRN